MRKSFHPVLFVLIVFALGVSTWYILHSRQPSYQGKPVGFWIQSLTNANPAEGEKALEEIGLPALPYLVPAFENKGRRPSVWDKLWNNVPGFVRKFRPTPFPWRSIHGSLTEIIGFIGSRHRWNDGVGDTPSTPEIERAVQALARSLSDPDTSERMSCASALAFIGPNAKNASPALVAMFSRGNSQEKIFAGQALGTIGPCSTVQESVGALQDGLNSPDPDVIRSAADALGNIGAQAAPAVPSLVKLITNGNEGLRRSAVRALARIGNLPNDVRPPLLLLLNDTNAFMRAGAAIALLRLDSNEAPAMSAAEDSLTPEKPPNLRSSTIFLVAGSPSLAEKFLPELRKLENDPDFNVAAFARKALKQVNTNVAAKTNAN
jgi:hypothetical protein